AEWRLQDAEKGGNVRHAAGHRTGSVLLVRDGNDPALRDEPQRRLQADDVFDRGGTGDRPVRFRPDLRRAQVRGDAVVRTGARPPGGVAQVVRVDRVSTPRAPADG